MIKRNIAMINSLDDTRLNKGVFKNLLLSRFLETDPLEYETITPEIAKYYILYYKSSYSVEYLFKNYKTTLKAFVKFMVLKNVINSIDIFDNIDIEKPNNNVVNRNDYINYMMRKINNTINNVNDDEIKKCLDHTRLEFYIYTKRMNTLRHNNFKCDLSIKDKLIITKELLVRIEKFDEDCYSENEIDVNSIINNSDDFNYLLILLKVYIIFSYNYILNSNNGIFSSNGFTKKNQDILNKITNIGYLIGYNNLGNLLLSYKVI